MDYAQLMWGRQARPGSQEGFGPGLFAGTDDDAVQGPLSGWRVAGL